MNQEQSTNTPDFWGKKITDTIEGILMPVLEGPLADDRKKVIEENVQRWVLNIREDEIQAILCEVEKRRMNTSETDFSKLLRDRLTELRAI